jgi:hypothetical protein
MPESASCLSLAVISFQWLEFNLQMSLRSVE